MAPGLRPLPSHPLEHNTIDFVSKQGPSARNILKGEMSAAFCAEEKGSRGVGERGNTGAGELGSMGAGERRSRGEG